MVTGLNDKPGMWRTRTALAMVLMLSMAHPAGAQFTAAGVVSTMSMKADSGLGCSTSLGSGTFGVLSWQWGESNSTTTSIGGGSGAGRVSFQGLNVTKNFDTCSPALALATARGTHVPKIVLTQYDKNSNLMITVQLEDVSVQSYQIGGVQSGATPTEQVNFGFAKITITHPSGVKIFYDTKTQIGG